MITKTIGILDKKGGILPRFFWTREPKYHTKDGRVHVNADPNTGLWQGTYNGAFDADANCLLTNVSSDFSVTVRTESFPALQNEQCGLTIGTNAENWIKVATEYIDSNRSRLISVVTNLGWSDLAIADDRPSTTFLRWYRIQSRGKDFLIEASLDGEAWNPLRVAHLHYSSKTLSVGIFACSPSQVGGFEAIFDHFSLGDSNWTDASVIL